MINKKRNKKTMKFSEKIGDDIFYLRVDFICGRGVIEIIAANRLVFGEVNSNDLDAKWAGKLPGYARTENINLSFYKAVIKHLIEGYPEKTFYFSGTDSRRDACYARFFKKMGIKLESYREGFTFSGGK